MKGVEGADVAAEALDVNPAPVLRKTVVAGVDGIGVIGVGGPARVEGNRKRVHGFR